MKCPGCGADMRFDPATQSVVCDHCDTKLSPKQCADMEKVAAEGKDVLETTVYTCPQCGASVMTTDDTVVTFCSYCGTSVALEGRLSRETRPDYVIPFLKTKAECEELYLKKVRRSFFAPKAMKQDETVDKFRGIYMPYWIYELQNNAPATGTGSRSERRGNYIYTYSYRSEQDYDARYKGLSYDASSSFSDNLSEAIAPFDTRGKEPFNSAYLSGFYADAKDVRSYVYMDDAKQTVTGDLASRIVTSDTYGLYGIPASSVEKSVSLRVTPESGYFPVWFLVNKIKGTDRVSYAVVNGQTGRVAVDIPIDFSRYLLFSLLLAVPIFLFLAGFFTLTAKGVLLAAIFIGALAWILAGRLLNKVWIRENETDDKGRMFASGITGGGKFRLQGAPFRIKGKTVLKIVAGIAIGVGFFLLNPDVGIMANDAWYYGIAGLSMLLDIWAFFDIVKGYNLLATRKPPQLGKRGGDEHA